MGGGSWPVCLSVMAVSLTKARKVLPLHSLSYAIVGHQDPRRGGSDGLGCVRGGRGTDERVQSSVKLLTSVAVMFPMRAMTPRGCQDSLISSTLRPSGASSTRQPGATARRTHGISVGHTARFGLIPLEKVLEIHMCHFIAASVTWGSLHVKWFLR